MPIHCWKETSICSILFRWEWLHSSFMFGKACAISCDGSVTLLTSEEWVGAKLWQAAAVVVSLSTTEQWTQSVFGIQWSSFYCACFCFDIRLVISLCIKLTITYSMSYANDGFVPAGECGSRWYLFPLRTANQCKCSSAHKRIDVVLRSDESAGWSHLESVWDIKWDSLK